MASYIDHLITFIGRNAVVAPWIMLVFAAFETTAFLSILIPSTAVMVAVGAFAANGVLDFWALVAGATLGAVIGSTFSYWLGLQFGPRALKIWPLRDHPDWLEKAQDAFAKWGPVAVLLGHFTTILRPVVFLTAGVTRMAFWRFAIWNSVGCVLWAFVVLKFGEIGGVIASWLYSTIFS